MPTDSIYNRLRDSVLNFALCALHENGELLSDFDSLTTPETYPRIEVLIEADHKKLWEEMNRLNQNETALVVKLDKSMRSFTQWENVERTRKLLEKWSRCDVIIGLTVRHTVRNTIRTKTSTVALMRTGSR